MRAGVGGLNSPRPSANTARLPANEAQVFGVAGGLHRPSSIESWSASPANNGTSQPVIVLPLAPLPFSVADRSHIPTPAPGSSPHRADLDNWMLCQAEPISPFPECRAQADRRVPVALEQ